MKLRKLTLALAVLFSVWAFADNFVTITFTDGTTTKKSVDTNTETLSFNDAMNALVFSDGTQYSFSDIDHIGFTYEEPSETSDVIYVTWNGTSEPTINCSASGVTYTVSGGDVTFTNTNTDTEYTYILDGSSTAGSFTLASDYKTTIKLNGLELQSDLEEALNIKCGKRVALELVDGTTNTLADCTTDNGQKAALYCKGHLEVSGAGTLNLTGNIKHGISTKEYCQLKKTVGTINILKAASDGIHAGQYFQMNGGKVTISGVGGDGIQAEVTDDATDENNGQMIIKGGTIDVSVTADDVAALQSDSLMTISGGTITANCTGAADKAFKSDTDIIINDGDITITNSGTGLVDTESTTTDDNTDTAKGISVDNNLYVVGGTVNITMTGNGGKGIKADNNVYIGDETTQAGPTLNVTTTGSTYSSGSGNGGNSPWGAASTNGWGPGGNPGGGGDHGGGGNPGGDSSGSSAKAIKAMGNAYVYGGNLNISTSTDGAEGLEAKTGVYIEGGQNYFKCYDDCINSNGCIYFNGGTTICYGYGNDAVDSNAGKTGAITIGNGNIFAFSTKGSPEEGIDADNNSYLQITGTGIAISAGASQGGGSSSSTISNAAQGYAFVTSTISYTSGRYYTLADVDGNNLVTYSFPTSCSSSMALFTATGMVKGSKYNVKYSTTAPTDATTVVGGGSGQAGFYIGSTAVGTTSVTNFVAK